MEQFRGRRKNEMCENKKYWSKYYKGDPNELEFKCKYSVSDRSRYYMNTMKVEHSIKHLLKNLDGCIPYSLFFTQPIFSTAVC